MPRFFLHLRDGTDETLDPEGRELPDMESLRKTVLSEARELMGGDLTSGGVIDLRYRIDVEDPNGTVIYSLPFKHAVNVIPDA
jgi:hypothetical protein